MVKTPEKHFKSPERIRDIVIGMADGLTVPFALAAGLTGAIAASRLILTAGLAEIAAGSISMGLGGYLAAKGDAEHYHRERMIEEREVRETPEQEAQEIRDIFSGYGLDKHQTESIVKALRKDEKAWIDFMMTNELGLEKPIPKRARNSALTIALSYVIGGFVPLSPYFFMHNAREAVVPSVIVTLIALFLFGFFKARVAGINVLKSALETMLVGSIAAAAAFTLAKLIS